MEIVYYYPDFPSREAAALLVDKPQGWTSFDVIRKLRRILGVKKIGHAGTLDPMATGLLICLVGKATKTMEHFLGLPKTYTGTLRLGEETPSYDADLEVTVRREWSQVTASDLESTRQQFLGEIEQIPPMYSAVKVGGERLYKKARRGEVIERAARKVVIYDFKLTDVAGPDVSFEIRCTKGTYIRSLAHDFGAVLGVGAHLTALRRTTIGEHHVNKAWSIEQLEQAASEQQHTSSGNSALDNT
jgi:tRNA pseudouridine55 synthase